MKHWTNRNRAKYKTAFKAYCTAWLYKNDETWLVESQQLKPESGLEKSKAIKVWNLLRAGRNPFTDNEGINRVREGILGPSDRTNSCLAQTLNVQASRESSPHGSLDTWTRGWKKNAAGWRLSHIRIAACLAQSPVSSFGSSIFLLEIVNEIDRPHAALGWQWTEIGAWGQNNFGRQSQTLVFKRQ